MTAIVGVEHDGVVTIGGDSAGVAGLDIQIRDDTKVFARDGYVFGFTSSFRMGQLLRYCAWLPEPNTWDIDRFMVVEFIAAVRRALTDGGYTKNESGRESAGTFLVGVAGRLYSIQNDFQIARTIDGYQAVGCGESYALGVLHATRSVTDPVERVTMALAATEYHSAGVAAPFTIAQSDIC